MFADKNSTTTTDGAKADDHAQRSECQLRAQNGLSLQPFSQLRPCVVRSGLPDDFSLSLKPTLSSELKMISDRSERLIELRSLQFDLPVDAPKPKPKHCQYHFRGWLGPSKSPFAIASQCDQSIVMICAFDFADSHSVASVTSNFTCRNGSDTLPDSANPSGNSEAGFW